MLEEYRAFLVSRGKAENTVKSYCLAAGAYLNGMRRAMA